MPSSGKKGRKERKNHSSGELSRNDLLIVIDSLLESISEVYGDTPEKKEKLDSIAKELKEHIDKGYPFPISPAELAVPGTSVVQRLEALARKCEQIRKKADAEAAGKTGDETGGGAAD